MFLDIMIFNIYYNRAHTDLWQAASPRNHPRAVDNVNQGKQLQPLHPTPHAIHRHKRTMNNVTSNHAKQFHNNGHATHNWPPLYTDKEQSARNQPRQTPPMTETCTYNWPELQVSWGVIQANYMYMSQSLKEFTKADFKQITLYLYTKLINYVLHSHDCRII